MSRFVPLFSVETGARLLGLWCAGACVVCSSTLVCVACESRDVPGVGRGEQTQKLPENSIARARKDLVLREIAARLKNLPRDEIIVFADPAKQRLAGDLK